MINFTCKSYPFPPAEIFVLDLINGWVRPL